MRPILLMLLFLGQWHLYAQKPCSGIFLSADDYQKNHISLVADTTLCRKNIRIDDFFMRPFVWIKSQDSLKKIPRNSVFAVKTAEGKVYRLANDENYQLIDSSKIFIYLLEKTVYVPVRKLYTTRFDTKTVREYYFSCSKTSPIQLLTLQNLRLAMLQNKSFDEELIVYFPSDQSLLKQNEQGQFEINQFLMTKK